MNLRVIPSAHADVLRIESTLDQYRMGWGYSFIDLVEQAHEEILHTPRQFSLAEDAEEFRREVREYFIARFEIRVIYIVEDDIITILAYTHARQAPGTWQHQLYRPW